MTAGGFIARLPRPLRPAYALTLGHGVVQGVKIPLDRKVMSKRLISAICNGTYESSEARILSSVIAPNDRVLELGAGVGFISTLLARLAPLGHVTVYEANPDLMPIIQATHAMNGVTATVVNGVLADGVTVDRLTFYKSRDFWAGSLDPRTPDVIGTAVVPVHDLATVLKTTAPTALVFDIEGGEHPLFLNAKLDGVRTIIGEFHPAQLGLGEIGRIIRNFLAQGFEIDTTLSQPNVHVFRRG